MLKRLFDYYNTEKVRSTALIFFSSLASAGFGFFSFIIVSRSLGPSLLGVITSITASVSLVSGLFELGLGASVVRFIPSLLSADKDKAAHIIRSAWLFKLGTGLLLSAGGIIVAMLSGQRIIDDGINQTLTVLAFIGVIFTNVDTLQISILQAYQQFKKVALSNGLASLIRLFILGALVYFSLLTVKIYAILTFLALPVFTAFFNYFLTPGDFTRAKGGAKNVFQDIKYLLGYGKWIYTTSLLIIIIQRVDILMLAKFRGSAEVGIYAVAMQMAFILPMIMRSINTVLIPHISKGTTKSQIKSIFNKNTYVAIGITVCALPLIVFAGPVLQLLFGPKYNNSILPFQILAVNYLIQIFVTPYTTLQEVYAPHVSTYRCLLVLAFSVIGNYLVIPQYGSIGASFILLIIAQISNIWSLSKAINIINAKAD